MHTIARCAARVIAISFAILPVVACGGAGNIRHLRDAIKLGGASAAAAGSMFVFQGPLHGVLISYPSPRELKTLLEA